MFSISLLNEEAFLYTILVKGILLTITSLVIASKVLSSGNISSAYFSGFLFNDLILFSMIFNRLSISSCLSLFGLTKIQAWGTSIPNSFVKSNVLISFLSLTTNLEISGSLINTYFASKVFFAYAAYTAELLANEKSISDSSKLLFLYKVFKTFPGIPDAPNAEIFSFFKSLIESNLFDELDLGKAPETSYPTVGGLVYELSEEPPYKGKVVKYDTTYDNNDLDNPIVKHYELHFKVDRVIKRRIKSLILEINEVEFEETE